MKKRFTTIDIRAIISEIKRQLLGLRVVNVYDIDSKTYLIKLVKPDCKQVLLIESGIRFHITDFEWPKGMTPSGFSMKLRKHLRTRRLVDVNQLGIDRIVDFQFGSGEAAYHLIVEFYDRGNIVLTDYEYMILSLLRTRTDKENEDVRFAVREQYPCHLAKQPEAPMNIINLKEIINNAKQGSVLKRVLNPHLIFGPAVIEHCLLGVGFDENVKVDKEFDHDRVPQVHAALEEAEKYMTLATEPCKGYITLSSSKTAKHDADYDKESDVSAYAEFHPFLFRQHEHCQFKELTSFNKAVDNFYSQLESQKLNVKAMQAEHLALRKLDNVRKDHQKRIEGLQRTQDENIYKAQMIEINIELVDKAITVMCSAIASQMDWREIDELLKEAQVDGDPVAGAIKKIKLEINQISILLRDPYEDDEDYVENEESDKSKSKGILVDIDLSLSAYANAKRYFDQRRYAATKEHKTVKASKSALKSAQERARRTRKEAATVASINKIRRTYWFEKFLWFISSENYLVIAGRDQQQNELIVKRHLQSGDLYVHADLHGASSIIIKNPSGDPVPPVTLNEAGCMAICYSAAWKAKVITSAWWVYHHQVSKTAPTGEYLQTGSFMIRGKKNYLPPSQLILGFGFLFKVDDASIANHLNERKARETEDYNSTLDISDDDHNSTLNDAIEIEKLAKEAGEKISFTSESSDEDNNDDTAVDEISSLNVGVDNAVQNDNEVNRDAGVGNDIIASQMFPDTNINLQYVKGDRFELQRGAPSLDEKLVEEENVIYLGDDMPISLTSSSQTLKHKGRPRLSAKERRQLRKNKLHTERTAAIDSVSELKTEDVDLPEDVNDLLAQTTKEPNIQQQLPALKRGQRAKLKKIKKKYSDQDEEERMLRMEILGSCRPSTENTKKKENKKNKKNNQETKKNRQEQYKASTSNNVKDITSHTTETDVSVVDDGTFAEGVSTKVANEQQEVIEVNESASKDAAIVRQDDVDNHSNAEISDEEERAALLNEENVRILEESNKTLSYVNSLTGCPVLDDVLLFAIPVCAPYGAMQNYKFKAKLIPGSNKRGKAIKAAVQLFCNVKDCTQHEKELIKIVKDNDMVRYLPNPVKLSAPNLIKKK